MFKKKMIDVPTLRIAKKFIRQQLTVDISYFSVVNCQSDIFLGIDPMVVYCRWR